MKTNLTKSWLAIALVAALWWLPSPARAQDDSRKDYLPELELDLLAMRQARVPDGEGAEERKVTGQASIAKHLLPGDDARVWRSASLTFTWLDQPDEIVFTRAPMDGEPPDLRVLDSITNPESRLRQLGLTVSPGQWFRSAADFTAAYTIATSTATKALVNPNSDPLEELVGQRRTKLDYLAWTGRGGTVKRLAAGLELTVNRSDRSRIAGTAATPEFIGDRDATTFTLSFDPDLLVRFAGDLSTAYAALDAHTLLRHENESGLNGSAGCSLSDKESPIRCLNVLTGRNIKGRWLAGLLPTLSIKREDQFDFVNLNGQYIRDPRIEGSLETYTLTWDLRTALNSAKHRRDAVTAIALHEKLVKRDEMRQLTLKVDAPGELESVRGELLFQPFFAWYKNADGSDSDLPATPTWTLQWLDESQKEQKKPIKELGLTLTADGTLIGIPNRVGEFKLLLEATDGHLNKWSNSGKEIRFLVSELEKQEKVASASSGR